MATSVSTEKNLHEILKDAPMMNDSNSAVHSGFTNFQVQKSSKSRCKYSRVVRFLKLKMYNSNF